MDAKLYPSWNTEVQKTLDYLDRAIKTFPFDKTAKLIDYLASKKIVLRQDLLKKATQINGGDEKNFVQTTLSNVTMAIHETGDVPDPGGWYFEYKKLYVMDRGFSAAWREARP